MIFRIVKILTLFLGLMSPVSAEVLKKPAGETILTVSGLITQTNSDALALLDLEMLQSLPTREFVTTTIWTKGPQTFVGVELSELAEHLGFHGKVLQASAINDYSIELPITDAAEGRAMIAYMRNGEAMTRRNKGPLWLVYPYDSAAEFRNEVIYARSIWQLNRIAVLDDAG